MRRAAALTLAALLAVLTSGCSSEPDSSVATSDLPDATPAPSPSEPVTTAPAAPAPPPPVTGRPGAPVDVATGLPLPWSLAVLPDGSALVSLRDEARVVRVGADGATVPVTGTGPDGQVPGVQPDGEGGLLGLAVAPTFAEDGLVYAYLTSGADNRVVRMRLDGDTLGEPEVLLGGIPANSTHNGGRLAFGPDGMLYVTTGDAQDRPAAQDPSSLGGKILRLAPDGQPAPGNPFPASPVWSLGHRNVQGLGWDPQGRMFASEFGQDRLDELNLIQAGGNYGWPDVEGTGGGEGFVDPLVTWSTDAASPSGLLVTGDAVYLAALRGERLWRVPVTDGQVGEPESFVAGELGRVRDVAVSPDRTSLWLLTNNTQGQPEDRLVSLPLQ